MKKNSGFTLVELMITVSIVAILLTVGVPSLRTFMQGNQLIASTNELISALHVARSEAIKLNSKVSICSSSNGTSCSGSSSWKEGWIVFVDADGLLDGTGAACTAVNTDCLLRVHEGFTDNQLTVKGVDSNSAAITSFTFTSRGLPKANNGSSQSGVFSICSLNATGNTIRSRAVVLSLSGRVRVSDNAAVISCPP
ncbi:MAG TPA: prepilin-type N-terminal cleavage/methylation domain-containing protein [Gammaproteobacteria bacterium]|nr:prepilin-type N-terminal cleavage/methylation domain-containing protein [Gammaproteobacteria bacterium]